MKAKLLVVLFIAVAGVSLRAAVITQWTFETSQPTTAGPISSETGSGSASASGLSVLSSPLGNGSLRAYSGTGWNIGDYWQFQVSTLGFEAIAFSFSQTSSSSGPANFKLTYSTDGVAFTDFQSYTVLNHAGSWNSSSPTIASQYSFDLSSVAALNNNNSLYFRLVNTSTTSTGGGTVGSNGTNRVDNVTVSGTAIAAQTVPDTLPTGAFAVAMLSVLAFRRYSRRSENG